VLSAMVQWRTSDGARRARRGVVRLVLVSAFEPKRTFPYGSDRRPAWGQ